jgi:hypothetical protein
LENPLASQPRDLLLLGSQLVARLDGPLVHMLAGRQQLETSAFGERLHSDRAEPLVGGAELLARGNPPPPTAQPFAVEQMRAGELWMKSRATQPVDRLAVRLVGRGAVAYERARTGQDPERPIRGSHSSGRNDALERTVGHLRLIASDCRFEELDGRPHGDEQLRGVVTCPRSRTQRLPVTTEPVEKN